MYFKLISRSQQYDLGYLQLQVSHYRPMNKSRALMTDHSYYDLVSHWKGIPIYQMVNKTGDQDPIVILSRDLNLPLTQVSLHFNGEESTGTYAVITSLLTKYIPNNYTPVKTLLKRPTPQLSLF